jgi:hypothetical protein
VLAAGAIVVAMHPVLSHDFQPRVRMFERIGDAVGHSRNVLVLDHDYGIPLEYYGLVSALGWPSRADMRVERLSGLRDISPRQRFEGKDARYFPAVPTFNPRPRFFVVTDLRELAAQPALKRFLLGRFPLVARGRGYLIFDLLAGLRQQTHR